jgi:hypothetical protein
MFCILEGRELSHPRPSLNKKPRRHYGEPLLYPGLEEVLLFAGRVPLKIKVCMNATLVRPHHAALLKEVGRTANISLRRKSTVAISAPTIRTRIARSLGSCDFPAFPAVVMRKVTV